VVVQQHDLPLSYWQLWQSAGTLVQPIPFVPRHANELHWMPDEQLWLPEQITSHAHDAPHDTFLHAWAPEQFTEHGPTPHCTFSHDDFVEHSIVHEAAFWQLMPLRHALSVLHAMSHL
jgi:hypothetical protein